ncbi:MAG: hypothetical protein OFPII_23710 [Osedax symbiont Rs1]|nr:MAG: hypothetical protein OFPII_23710 [Osedax symbiont Rs1]
MHSKNYLLLKERQKKLTKSSWIAVCRRKAKIALPAILQY